MNSLEKDALYDELCQVLADFDEADPGYMRPDDDVVYPMYEVLCKIENCWDDLVG